MRRHLMKFLAVLSVAFFAFSGVATAAEVVLYSSNPSELLDLVTKGFEAKTGIKASVVRLGTGEAMKRIAAEKDRPLCDVFWSGDVSVLENAKENFQSYKSPEAKAKTEYLTTVVLRRFGEARVRGDAQVKVLVRFKDGTTETRRWDGQARWTRLEFIKPVEVESAQVDPEGVWLIDANLANNSRGVDGLRRNVVKLLTQLLFTVQNLLQFVSSWS